jgi:hypothetical protein
MLYYVARGRIVAIVANRESRRLVRAKFARSIHRIQRGVDRENSKRGFTTSLVVFLVAISSEEIILAATRPTIRPAR